MRRAALSLAVLAALIGPAGAQFPPKPTYQNQLGSVTPLPMNLIMLCPGSHGVSLAIAVGLTLPRGTWVGAPGTGSCVTAQVNPTYCVATARTASVFYTLDGSTPTSNNSTTLPVGSSILLTAAMIPAWQAFSSTGTLDVECAQ
jgi:hypothetical protein